MAKLDDWLTVVEAVHAAALDAELWPAALAGVTRVVGGVGATLEVVEKPSMRPREFHQFGLPPASEIPYVEQFATISPRLAVVSRQRAGRAIWDYLAVDERAIDRSAFYMDFLARFQLRYYVGGILANSADEFAAVTVQRSRKQGHAEPPDIFAMERLLPHLRQALDVSRRLQAARGAANTLEQALDRLADGVALVRPNGSVLYANDALRTIAGQNDGITIATGAIHFAAPETHARLIAVLAAVASLRGGEAREGLATDFAVPRPSRNPPYVVSVQPLPRRWPGAADHAEAVVMIFVRDPLRPAASVTAILGEMYGLTRAEAHLAQALLAGVPVARYARESRVTLNTAYTHLRRLREKTGCHRMIELMRKLNEACVSSASHGWWP